MDKHILIIDDEATIRELLTTILSEEGYTVTDLEQVAGIEQVTAIKPDLVILDLKMPKVGGAELSRLLKNSPLTKAIPVLVLSATSNIDTQTIMADAFVAKPFNIDELLEQVTKLLEPAPLPLLLVTI